jgi:hypothetical protein
VSSLAIAGERNDTYTSTTTESFICAIVWWWWGQFVCVCVCFFVTDEIKAQR